MAEKMQPAVPKKWKLGIKWILIAASTLLFAGAGTFLYFRLFRGGPTAEASAPNKPSKIEVKSTLSLEPFLVNLADKDQVRYVKATFRLGLAGEKEGEVLGKNAVFTAAVRDAIISLLTSMTSEQILTSAGKDALRREILSKVNTLMPKGRAEEVYIVDFVVQL